MMIKTGHNGKRTGRIHYLFFKGGSVMKKLFIIGNGFDSAHGLHTSYEHFHQYLKTTYPDANEEDDQLPGVYQTPDGGEDCDDIETVGFIMRLITQAEPNSEQWSALEESLGRLDFSEVFDWLPEQIDRDGDEDMWATSYQNEDVANELSVVIEKLSDYFTDWINTINLSKVQQIAAFGNLIGSEDVFLNFNYTETLEVVYRVENKRICHIHGKRGEELIFGHGEDESDDTYDRNMQIYTGAENTLSEIHYMLKKDTDKAILQHKDFFDLLDPGIECIYSHGFSFGKVDLPYIEKICECLPTKNMTWYLNDFDIHKHESYKKILKDAGFEGEFSTFSTN